MVISSSDSVRTSIPETSSTFYTDRSIWTNLVCLDFCFMCANNDHLFNMAWWVKNLWSIATILLKLALSSCFLGCNNCPSRQLKSFLSGWSKLLCCCFTWNCNFVAHFDYCPFAAHLRLIPMWLFINLASPVIHLIPAHLLLICYSFDAYTNVDFF